MTDAGFLRVLRVAALIVVLAGAGGSLGLMLYAGRRNRSVILALLFAIWVLSPFIAAVWANVVSKRWTVPTRATLNAVTLVLTLGSLAIYADVAFGHPGVKTGFVFLVVPLASWALMAIAVPIAAFLPGRRSHRA